MSESHTLTLEKRDTFGKKLGSVRKGGKLPVVVYGAKHKTESYFADLGAFKKVWKQAGESTLVSLKDGGKNFDVLIQEVAIHPLSGEPVHVDFLAVDTSKPVEVKIALAFVGTSPAVKNLGAILTKVMHEIEVRILPKHLVHEIEVDLGKLENFGDQIHASDITLPQTAELLTGADEVVALVSAPKEEKEEEAAPADLSSIEISEERGKKEDAEAAPAEAAKE